MVTHILSPLYIYLYMIIMSVSNSTICNSACNYRVWIHTETRTCYDKIIQSNIFSILAFLAILNGFNFSCIYEDNFWKTIKFKFIYGVDATITMKFDIKKEQYSLYCVLSSWFNSCRCKRLRCLDQHISPFIDL